MSVMLGGGGGGGGGSWLLATCPVGAGVSELGPLGMLVSIVGIEREHPAATSNAASATPVFIDRVIAHFPRDIFCQLRARAVCPEPFPAIKRASARHRKAQLCQNATQGGDCDPQSTKNR
ncbi:hypothetical protein [Aurantimonas sp. HBX-1]|uniref:hypothetical protein n=1 Tax=Aurantimonas sp. HBX-1 TaxID=2906072 RepID=UPI001F31C07B|nr:hypothetical protein [Aurantimonas sp. HBX-1]UIJ71872.1 hypothetical protein LXB15_19655 [Aurantimonas sp. HBX-1]